MSCAKHRQQELERLKEQNLASLGQKPDEIKLRRKIKSRWDTPAEEMGAASDYVIKHGKFYHPLSIWAVKQPSRTAAQRLAEQYNLNAFQWCGVGSFVTHEPVPKREDIIPLIGAKAAAEVGGDPEESPTVWNVVVVDRINKRDVRIYRSIDLIPEGFCAVCHTNVTIKTPIRVDTLWGKHYNGKCDRCGFGVNI